MIFSISPKTSTPVSPDHTRAARGASRVFPGSALRCAACGGTSAAASSSAPSLEWHPPGRRSRPLLPPAATPARPQRHGGAPADAPGPLPTPLQTPGDAERPERGLSHPQHIRPGKR